MVTCRSHPVLSQRPVLLYYMQMILSQVSKSAMFFRLMYKKKLLICTNHHLFPLLLFNHSVSMLLFLTPHAVIFHWSREGHREAAFVMNNRHLSEATSGGNRITISGELGQNGHMRGFAAFFPWEGSFRAVWQLWENMEWTTMWMTYVATALRTLSFVSWCPDAK